MAEQCNTELFGLTQTCIDWSRLNLRELTYLPDCTLLFVAELLVLSGSAL